jgi:hypothetical protein
MSEGSHLLKRPAEERFNLTRLGGLLPILLFAGLGLTLLSCIWGYFNPTRFGYAWLWAFMYFFTIACGCLFWTLVHHAVDASWTVVVRRILETGASLFAPWLPLLFIPFLFVLPDVYLWWTADLSEDPVLAAKAGFLNHGFMLFRVAAIFGALGLLAYTLRRFSTTQDETGDVNISIKSRKVAYPGIFFFGLAISFAGIDWLMAINHHWFSTMWGVYIFAGAAGSSLAFLILVSNALRRAGYLKEVFSVEHNHIMGKLLFAFTVFWAYIAFSQYMLIYYANIPEETIFFMVRNEGSWHWLSVFLPVGRFIIPFLLLLTQPAKRNAKRLCFSAAWILVMHMIDLYWIIMPGVQVFPAEKLGQHPHMHLTLHFLDILIWAGMACLVAFVFLRRLAQYGLFPRRDPRLYESVTLMN